MFNNHRLDLVRLNCHWQFFTAFKQAIGSGRFVEITNSCTRQVESDVRACAPKSLLCYEIMAPMNAYKSKANQLPGSSYEEVLANARKEYKKIENLTKRQPYVRSIYFKKDKVFLSTFWTHVMQKDRKVRTKRLKLFGAAVDLLRNSYEPPETIFKQNDLSVIFHRFYGVSKDGIEFCVQVKQDKRSGRKDLMSVFDRKLPKK